MLEAIGSQYDSDEVEVPAGALADVIEIDVTHRVSCGIEIANLGATALNAFEIHKKVHPAGGWQRLFWQAAQFATPSGALLAAAAAADGSSTDLTTLAGGARGYVDLSCTEAARILVRVGVAAGRTRVRARAIAK
jgi:hypothetical protein